MTVVSAVGGTLLVLVVIREVFHSLFHPSGQGGLTMSAFRIVWRVTGRLGPRARSVAGPLAMVLVIASWVGAMLVGWALIYLPWLPEGFILASSLTPAEQDGFLDALYYAWVTQATLGYGDIAPQTDVFRVLAPLQATIGFGLFTLVVTWVLSVYPALQRQRATASLAHGIRGAHEAEGISAADVQPTTQARRLERLADMLHGVRVDITQYPATFYFAAPSPTLSLAAALPFTAGIADAGDYARETRSAAAELQVSLELFATALAENHLAMPDASRDEVLREYRRHHGIDAPET